MGKLLAAVMGERTIGHLLREEMLKCPLILYDRRTTTSELYIKVIVTALVILTHLLYF